MLRKAFLRNNLTPNKRTKGTKDNIKNVLANHVNDFQYLCELRSNIMKKNSRKSYEIGSTQISIIILLISGLIIFGCKKDKIVVDNPPQTNLVIDIDSNIYHTITIGKQVWMVENLKVTRFNDGTLIPEVLSDQEWDTLTSGAYCWYNNDTLKNKNTYGALYNWQAVETGKLCPIGWHVPTDSDWIILSTFLGGDSLAGGKLKSIGILEDSTGLWYSPNFNATDKFGFYALPGGIRYTAAGGYGCHERGANGYWWSSTEESSDGAWLRLIRYSKSNLFRYDGGKNTGISVRCIKD